MQVGGRDRLSIVSATPLAMVQVTPSAAPEREAAVARARQLAWLSLGWHAVEASVAIIAGIAAGSVALVGFGADSLVEMIAGLVVLWRFAARRSDSDSAERRAQQLIAASFVLIAAYVGVEAVSNLVAAARPGTSWVGIGLAVATLATMPPLAIAKDRVARRIGSSATASEGRQNMLCAYLAAALLGGLLANTVLGWWWADPIVAIGIAAVALREARDAWRGESCDCCAPVG
jgi:divalent metal cation (Fe/Co/Zn/Cd) transporter